MAKVEMCLEGPADRVDLGENGVCAEPISNGRFAVFVRVNGIRSTRRTVDLYGSVNGSRENLQCNRWGVSTVIRLARHVVFH